MSWINRIKPAAYTSPSGKRYTFMFEDVKSVRTKNTTSFEYPDVDGTYVQDSGSSGRRYPLQCFFSGENYDREADLFENALFERGLGRLEHPIYGTINVVPSGDITRKDNLKTAANQAIIEVTFINTLGIIFGQPQENQEKKTQQTINIYNNIAPKQFSRDLDLQSELQKIDFLNSYSRFLDNAESSLLPLTQFSDDVNLRFNQINNSIISQINRGFNIIDTPQLIANQTLQLIQLPSRTINSFQNRLSTYNDLFNNSTYKNNSYIISPNPNSYRTRKLFVDAYCTGSVLAAINTDYSQKKEAINAAVTLLNQNDRMAEWQDNNIEALGLIDTGESYQYIQELLSIAAGFIIEKSFSLKQEKRLILDRNRTLIDVVAELYQDISDDTLNFFINSNNLSGSDILELKAGREVLYYV